VGAYFFNFGERIMSSLKFELDAELRNDIGRGASRRLRQANKVPAVMYGAGEAAVSVILDHNKTMQALSHEAFYSHILTLKMGQKNEKVILKAIQRHPVKPRIQHIDFLRVKADQKLHMQVPLHFIGEENAPGVKDGGVFSHIMSGVEVSCLPADLPEFIEVDLSGMELNQTLHLTELKLPKGVELVALAHGAEGHDLPVVSIHVPRVIEEEVVEAVAEEAAPAEGEAPAEPAADGEESKE
jgi:large subunit ribosomal protein L25